MSNEGMVIGLLIFVVASIYSSVGHGGASGYLAILTLFAFSPTQMATSALALNLLVAGISWVSYFRSRHFSLDLIFPFLISSIPFAFVGGWIKVSPHIYSGLLAGALMIAAIRIALFDGKTEEFHPLHTLNKKFAVFLGGGIGLVSGIVGIGGGIFLSPILLLFHWATAKQAAAASAFFIWINSLSGLLGRGMGSPFDASLVLPFLIPAFLGGVIGSRLGANRFSSLTVRRLLALVLLIAAFKAVRLALAG